MTRPETETGFGPYWAWLDWPIAQARSDETGLWDSLDWINILFGLEEAFGIEFGENEALTGCSTSTVSLRPLSAGSMSRTEQTSL